ncbi:MBG domain-containing protein [Litoribacter populi]|uniref:MBG domain-containing protein n=1 Tax=Litoribacter populi TaxID=2598460 RepID=UPI00117D382F|nr:MBG domain-containing protein [Litoribacter populi]
MNKNFTNLINPKSWQIILLGLFLVTAESLLAQSTTRVSVFNYPGLNGTGTACGHENYNLISIIDLLPEYEVDASIVSFADQSLLSDQLEASTFFFMTDMETKGPNDLSFLPVASREVFRNWVNNGGVMVMTGTAGANDTDFLNLIFGWDLGTVNGSSWSKNIANTTDTPFEFVTAPSLPNLSATDAIRRNSVPNFKSMWGTDDNAVVAVIQFGSGYVIFMGFDFFNTGPTCPQFNSVWVQQVIPAALDYASALSASVSNNTYDQAELNYKFNQNGTVHYILVPAGSPAPTSAQIESGQNYGGVNVINSGNDAVVANQDQSIVFSDLDYGTSYDVYVVFKYEDGGSVVFSDINQYNFTTLTNDSPEYEDLNDFIICANDSISFDLNISDEFPGNNVFTVNISSSNKMLFPDESFKIFGSENERNISLTPSENQFGSADITIEIADSEGATTTKTFQVQVIQYPVISYSYEQVELAQNVRMEDVVPLNTGGEVSSGGWSISPTLPEGLHFDNNTGKISGTPLLSSLKTPYTITAASSNCEDSFTISIGIKSSQMLDFEELPTKRYGQDIFTLGEAKSSAGLPITYTAEDPEVIQIVGNQATILKAGSTKITASQEGDDLHFAASEVVQTLTIDKAVLTVTADPQTKVYGEANPELTFQYSGWVNGEENIDTPPSISTTVDKTTQVGSHKDVITLNDGEDNNYTFDFVSAAFEVTKAVLTVTADEQSKVYGEANPELTFQYSGWVNGEETIDTPPSISTTVDNTTGVGTHKDVITLSDGEDNNYTFDFVSAAFEVTKAVLKVTADPQTKVYGRANPELTFQYSGWVNGEETIDTPPSISTTVDKTTQVGTHKDVITLSDGEDNNYTFDFVAGAFEVTKAVLTVTADEQSKVYGEANPELTFQYSGWVNGEETIDTPPSISTTVDKTTQVGSHKDVITMSHGEDNNYTFDFVSAAFEVTKAVLTVTADEQSKVYGEANPELTFQYSGWVNGEETIDTPPSISTTVDNTTGVGTHKDVITMSHGEDNNYTFDFVSAAFEVTKAVLTVTADPQTKVYGETNPELTFQYSGWVNSEEIIDTPPSISTTVDKTTQVGSHKDVITLTDGEDNNYTFKFAAGEFEVTKAPLTIKAENKAKVYGQDNPELTFVYEGLVNGDNHTEDIPVISTDADSGSNVGIYDITLTQAKDQNYEITLEGAKLEIIQAPLTIKAEDKAKVYGQDNPELTFVYEGLVNGDNHTKDIPEISTDADSGSNVGIYDIILAQAKDQNYEITLEGAKLEITQAPLTITAENRAKVYGQDNPELTFVYEGLVNGDTQTEVIPVISTDADSGSNVGIYDITLAQAKDQNYEITLEGAKLEITQAPLTIKAEDKSKVYGQDNPELTFVYEGLVNGDTQSEVIPVISTDADSGSNVGIYDITLAQAKDQNYAITLEGAKLEITPAQLAVFALSGQGKIYGQQDGGFEFNADGFQANDGYEIFNGTLNREKGESPGDYKITLGTLDAGSNYQVNYKEEFYHITAITVETIMDPADVQAAWGHYPEIPENLVVMSQDGRFLEIPVTWDFSEANNLARGVYPVTGQLESLEGITNPNKLSSTISFTVLPKGSPEDIVISNTTFKGSIKEFFIHIGHLEVIDPLDDIHLLELVQGADDNGYFEIIDNSLYWSSAERVPGKTQFRIQIKVIDRDGNELVKTFVIDRTRMEVDEITIYNSFTPDGDGVNDDWGINDLRFYSGVSISVFERSGKRVFYTEDPDQRWDGTFNNIGLASGTYYYVVEIKELNRVRKGMLTILKK